MREVGDITKSVIQSECGGRRMLTTLFFRWEQVGVAFSPAGWNGLLAEDWRNTYGFRQAPDLRYTCVTTSTLNRREATYTTVVNLPGLTQLNAITPVISSVNWIVRQGIDQSGAVVGSRLAIGPLARFFETRGRLPGSVGSATVVDFLTTLYLQQPFDDNRATPGFLANGKSEFVPTTHVSFNAIVKDLTSRKQRLCGA